MGSHGVEVKDKRRCCRATGPSYEPMVVNGAMGTGVISPLQMELFHPTSTYNQKPINGIFRGSQGHGTPWAPYYSHTTPIRIPKDMGMVWE